MLQSPEVWVFLRDFTIHSRFSMLGRKQIPTRRTEVLPRQMRFFFQSRALDVAAALRPLPGGPLTIKIADCNIVLAAINDVCQPSKPIMSSLKFSTIT